MCLCEEDAAFPLVDYEHRIRYGRCPYRFYQPDNHLYDDAGQLVPEHGNLHTGSLFIIWSCSAQILNGILLDMLIVFAAAPLVQSWKMVLGAGALAQTLVCFFLAVPHLFGCPCSVCIHAKKHASFDSNTSGAAPPPSRIAAELQERTSADTHGPASQPPQAMRTQSRRKFIPAARSAQRPQRGMIFPPVGFSSHRPRKTELDRLVEESRRVAQEKLEQEQLERERIELAASRPQIQPARLILPPRAPILARSKGSHGPIAVVPRGVTSPSVAWTKLAVANKRILKAKHGRVYAEEGEVERSTKKTRVTTPSRPSQHSRREPEALREIRLRKDRLSRSLERELAEQADIIATEVATRDDERRAANEGRQSSRAAQNEAAASSPFARSELEQEAMHLDLRRDSSGDGATILLAQRLHAQTLASAAAFAASIADDDDEDFDTAEPVSDAVLAAAAERAVPIDADPTELWIERNLSSEHEPIELEGPAPVDARAQVWEPFAPGASAPALASRPALPPSAAAFGFATSTALAESEVDAYTSMEQEKVAADPAPAMYSSALTFVAPASTRVAEPARPAYASPPIATSRAHPVVMPRALSPFAPTPASLALCSTAQAVEHERVPRAGTSRATPARPEQAVASTSRRPFSSLPPPAPLSAGAPRQDKGKQRAYEPEITPASASASSLASSSSLYAAAPPLSSAFTSGLVLAIRQPLQHSLGTGNGKERAEGLGSFVSAQLSAQVGSSRRAQQPQRQYGRHSSSDRQSRASGLGHLCGSGKKSGGKKRSLNASESGSSTSSRSRQQRRSDAAPARATRVIATPPTTPPRRPLVSAMPDEARFEELQDSDDDNVLGVCGSAKVGWPISLPTPPDTPPDH